MCGKRLGQNSDHTKRLRTPPGEAQQCLQHTGSWTPGSLASLLTPARPLAKWPECTCNVAATLTPGDRLSPTVQCHRDHTGEGLHHQEGCWRHQRPALSCLPHHTLLTKVSTATHARGL
ncbi:hypothetical protein H1C71_029275 [Ictidomys tridecemlineatus]|nr:hypothetical protein H1C71_029275 [Ictidomys tridecemlineatus]